MTDLERFATALLAQWRTGQGTDGGPIGVDAIIDHVLPYRTARRLLGIDSSEDYEATLLRLIGGEESLAETAPPEAAEMARTTMASKLPDLDVLRLLRSAAIMLPDAVVARLGDASFGGARAEADAKWNRGAAPEKVTPSDVPPVPDDSPAVVIPLPTAADHTRVAPPDIPPGPPPAYLTAQVEFIPPARACWSCGDELPVDRAVKFCPFCGADQRPPTCGECGAAVERHWKHCPDCGRKLKE